MNRMLMTSLTHSDWSISVTNSPHMGQTKKPLCLCRSLSPLSVLTHYCFSALFFYLFTENRQSGKLCFVRSDRKCSKTNTAFWLGVMCARQYGNHLSPTASSSDHLLSPVLKQIKQGTKRVPVNTRRTQIEREIRGVHILSG